MATRTTRRGSGRAAVRYRTVSMPVSTGSETLNARVVGVTADDGTQRVTTNTTGLGGGGLTRLRVGTDTSVSAGIIYTTPLTPNAQGDATHVISGMTRGTTYYYRVEMNSTSDTAGTVGRIVVAPVVASSFAFNFGSCCNASDSPSFTAMVARNDNLFVHLGDLWYADGTGQTTANYRAKFDTQIRGVNQGKTYATCPSVFTPSDHDIAMINNGVGLVDVAATAIYNSVYREKIPGNLVAPTLGVYETFAYGRVRFVKLDTRSLKSNPTDTDNAAKTMIGTTQKAWLKNIIDTCTEPVLVIASDTPWGGATTAGADDWAGYNTERVEIGNYINASTKQAVFLSGDMHAVAAGKAAAGLNIANYAAAPFSENNSIKAAGSWSAGPYPPSGSTAVTQYGRVVVTDTGGTTISLAFTGYSSDNTSRVTRTDTFNV